MAQLDIEKRFFKTEFRVVRKEDGALPKIEGYAAVFNSDSEDMGFIERIRPSAFKNALKRSDARALFNHDPNYILGRQSNGTLTLTEDKKGLHMSVKPPDTQLVRDMILTPIERGDITQQSFGFTVESDSWDGLDTDKPVRTIEKVRELFDVSPVTYPAYPDTEVSLRSLDTEVALRSLAAARGTGDITVKIQALDAESLIDELDENRDTIIELVNKEIEPRIIIISKGETTEQFDFSGDERFTQAADKINSLRSELNPTIPDSDNTDGAPTSKTPPDETIVEQDETLEQINKTIERYRA